MRTKSLFIGKLTTAFSAAALFTFSLQLQAAGVSLQSLKFFESGFEAPPRQQRVYKDSFPQRGSRFIFAEMKLENLIRHQPHTFNVKMDFLRPDGSSMGGPNKAFKMHPDWRYGHFWLGKGFRNSGEWDPGQYTVKVYVDEKLVATRKFTIRAHAATAQSGSSGESGADAPVVEQSRPAPGRSTGDPSGQAKVIYIEPRYRAAHFPAPKEVGPSNAEYATWELRNDSGEQLVMSYTIDGVRKSIVVKPWTSRSLYLRAGSYKVEGSLQLNGRDRPFNHNYLFRSGRSYESVIFAEKKELRR